MEGKEVRFGIFNSALFATITTDASCGAVNSMHDSFTPLGGFVPLFNIQLGEIIFGGVGAGLYGMLVFVVLAVFIAGLMVGRTPEYLGKKIQSYEVKMAMLSLLVLAVLILGFAAWAAVSKWGLAGFEQHGPARLERNTLCLQFRDGQQRQRFRRADREHPVVQHDARARDVDRTFPDDRSDHGDGRFARDARRLRRQARAHSRLSGGTFVVLLLGTVLLVGRIELSSCAGTGPDRRTLPDCRRETVLTHPRMTESTFDDTEISFSL